MQGFFSNSKTKAPRGAGDSAATNAVAPRRTLTERLRGVPPERKALRQRLREGATLGTLGEDTLENAASSDLLASGLHAAQLWSRDIGIKTVAERCDQPRRGLGGKVVPPNEMTADEVGCFLRSFGLHRHPEICEQTGGSWSVPACLSVFPFVSEAALRDELGLPHAALTSQAGATHYAPGRVIERHAESPPACGTRTPSPPPTKTDWVL